MKRTLRLSLLALLAFAVILVARFPAQWAAAALPQSVSCTQLAGTVWNGRCAALVVGGTRVGNLSWHLRPMSLLTGKLGADIDVTRGTGFARGSIEAASAASITVHNLQADFPLDRTLIPELPPNLAGSARTNLALARVENGIVTLLQGQVEARDLVGGSGKAMPLGNYSLNFPPAEPGSEPVGRLTSSAGPLDVEGTLRLTREPGYVLEGLVAARAGAPPELQQQLQYLGRPNDEGKRPFSLAGTF